jgi:hypothetical protein
MDSDLGTPVALPPPGLPRREYQSPAFAALVGGIELRLTFETLVCRLFRDASTGNLPDAQGAEVFDHGVDGRFQRSGVSADLAEQQAALDGGQRRECQVVDLGAVG